jgi:hypothetical protein
MLCFFVSSFRVRVELVAAWAMGMRGAYGT